MELYFARFLFGLLFRLALCPLILWLLLLPADWRDTQLFHVGATALGITWYLSGSWLAAKAARHHVLERRGFNESFKDALSDARVPLSFLPIVGPWFLARREGDREI
jgi:hypothetical protein